MTAPARRWITSWRRVDYMSLVLVPAGILVVLVAQLLEGGAAGSLLQGPAAVIVFGGTAVAVLISHSPREVLRALRAAADTFVREQEDHARLTAWLVGLAMRAHRKGLLALDGEIDAIADPFLRRGLSLVVDGVPAEQLQDALAAARAAHEAEEDAPARVFEAAAGYAPTLGILGAVLGLIQVMEQLENPGALGAGIAVAFVATIYGVGAANLLLLPIAGRLRERAAASALRRDIIVEGLRALQQRVHPRVVAQRLGAFADHPWSAGLVSARGAHDAPPLSRVRA